MLLVRKGGFAVARMAGEELVAHKVGQRHVQGRTKAGGQSQQRFARRRDKQAREAYEAAADHAVRVLDPVVRTGPVVTGGDRPAVDRGAGRPAAARADGRRALARRCPTRAVRSSTRRCSTPAPSRSRSTTPDRRHSRAGAIGVMTARRVVGVWHLTRRVGVDWRRISDTRLQARSGTRRQQAPTRAPRRQQAPTRRLSGSVCRLAPAVSQPTAGQRVSSPKASGSRVQR